MIAETLTLYHTRPLFKLEFQMELSRKSLNIAEISVKPNIAAIALGV